MDIDTTIRYLDALGAVWPQQNEIIMNMVRESGLFRFEIIPVDRATWYLPELPYQSSRGMAEGVVHVYDFATPDPVTSYLRALSLGGCVLERR